VLGAFASLDAGAVYLDPEGLGQALVYPYYTVRSTNGNPFNTFISVINHEATTKALRVRFREGRNGREVANFNLFLSPYDTWTGALVATGDGAKVISTDNSCTNPPFAPSGSAREVVFSSAAYSGANSDGLGEGGDRTREGYVEMIEMATLIGSDAVAVTHGSSGTPENCAAVQGASFAPAAQPPTGGLSGSSTLINVASGMDFTVNAEALTELSTQPFYRNYTDPYPDWNAAEVTPLSYFSSEGKLYRMSWSRGVDAVSSVFMRSGLENEFILDDNTRSETDWVITFPTRRFYVSGSSISPPFAAACAPIVLQVFDREERNEVLRALDSGVPSACFSVNTLDFRGGASPSGVFGSFDMMSTGRPSFSNGWAVGTFSTGSTAGLATLPNSWSRDLDGAQVEPGVYILRGLPAVGFMARTFENGTLSCAASACQGNYGGSFPHRVRRTVTRAP